MSKPIKKLDVEKERALSIARKKKMKLALANKETIVCGGEFIMDKVKKENILYLRFSTTQLNFIKQTNYFKFYYFTK